MPFANLPPQAGRRLLHLASSTLGRLIRGTTPRLPIGRRHSVAIASLLVLTMVQLPGAVSADPEPSGSPAAAPTPGLAPDEGIARLQDEALAAGALDIYRDDNTGEIVIVGDSESRQGLEAAALAQQAAPVRIETRDVSQEDIEAITSRLIALRSATQLAGESYRFGYDGRVGKVVLVATAPRSAFAEVFNAFPDLIEYRSGGPFNRSSRSADGEPHWGGVELTDGEGDFSGGYTVRKTSTGLNYMVSCGHCASLNEAIWQPDNGWSFGSVAFRAAFPATDAMLIGGETYSGRLYMGGEAGVQFPVWGAGNPALGAQYCFSGTAQNETCGHEAIDLDERICFPDGCTDRLVIFTIADAPGDSGGPIVLKGSAQVWVRGHLVGNSPGETYGHNWTTVRDSFGVTIVTAP